VQEKATAAALNKVAEKAKTEMKRQIAAEFNIKSSVLLLFLKLDKASWKNGKMVATLSGVGTKPGKRTFNVIRFDAKQVHGNGPPKRVKVQFPDGAWRTIIVREGGGVSVKIKRGGPRKLIKGAFIANQGRTVFIRTGDGRKPIRPVSTIGIPQMFNMRKVKKAVVGVVRREFPVEMDRALKMYLSRV
jgi:hypothetical protein